MQHADKTLIYLLCKKKSHYAEHSADTKVCKMAKRKIPPSCYCQLLQATSIRSFFHLNQPISPPDSLNNDTLHCFWQQNRFSCNGEICNELASWNGISTNSESILLENESKLFLFQFCLALWSFLAAQGRSADVTQHRICVLFFFSGGGHTLFLIYPGNNAENSLLKRMRILVRRRPGCLLNQMGPISFVDSPYNDYLSLRLNCNITRINEGSN